MAQLRVGLALLAVCLGLSGGTVAVAAPFDRYEVILWQDRTPAQMAGLAALGFTATKLRGSLGRSDPADMAQRRASGLPWYVENIATDFYAPYHRYTPGKPVTWLFDAAKERLRADPSDTGVFVREPGLSDPVWLAAIAERLTRVVGEQKADRPLFYNLADEAGIGDLAAAWDADLGPASLDGFRAWLQTQYGDLAALNGQWGTGFGSWGEVVPELTGDATRRTDGNFSAWADFKAWMDVAFARAVEAGRRAVHDADPAALAAMEGGQVPGWGGYDYSRLAPALDVMEIYDNGNALDLARAFNPALIPLRTSFGDGPREAHAAWRHLVHGGRGMVVWDERDDVVRSDGTPGPRGAEIAALVGAMNEVAPMLRGAVPDTDAVAVLYSPASFRTRWMLDRRAEGTPWFERDAAREYEANAWRSARGQVLRRLSALAVQPRLLSSAMVEAGELARSGARVLILPHAIALSDRETEAIRAFSRAGGTVLADTEPGLFDEHGKRRPVPSLSGVAQVPEAMLAAGAEPDDPDTLAAIAELLERAGARPRVRLNGPDGRPATGVDAQWLRLRDGRVLLALQPMVPWGAPERIEIMRPGARLTSVSPASATNGTNSVPLDPIRPVFLALE